MGNVYKFPTAKTPVGAIDPAKVKISLPKAKSVWGIFAAAWCALRTLIFFVLYGLRFPILVMCYLGFLPALLAFLFVWYNASERTGMVWGLGLVSFLAFMIPCMYDLMLLAIAPKI